MSVNKIFSLYTDKKPLKKQSLRGFLFGKFSFGVILYKKEVFI